MARQQYKRIRFTDESLAMIKKMNAVVVDFTAQGFVLTVRQLYYQLVAADLIPNTEQSYKSTCALVNNARLAGLMDWDAIEDRTRDFVRRQRFESGKSILGVAARSFHMDMWANQDSRPFVIVEKEALVGVLQRVCEDNDIPLLAARGYPSGTVLREFAQTDILPWAAEQHIVVIHLGDHDPSGLDMTRDLQERISLFAEGDTTLERIALNMAQIEERKPPPNPAKVTDSRFAGYQERFGEESWELDALPPSYLVHLVEDKIAEYRDEDAWEKRRKQIERIRTKLTKVAKDFPA